MESYSYADQSGDSSPCSRDHVDFDNHQPWEDNGYKVKFMCSYGGKIQPRPHHHNHLSYVAGDTKILAVDRFVKFAALMPKLTALCVDGGDVLCFKYQLPGEDLDALISVTNDDDLQHMMHEYDRLNRASPPTPARLRLFLFPVSGSQTPALTPVHSFGSTDQQGRSDPERFMDGLDLGHLHGNTELMFGLDKGMPSGPMSRHQIGDPQGIDTAVVDEPGNEAADHIQKRVQELRIAEQQQPSLYRKPSDDNLAAGYPGDYHVPRMSTEKVAPTTGYQIPPDQQQQQPVYMIHQTPTSMYMPRPVSAPVNQGQLGGYYVQRMPTEVYRDQPVYNVMPAAQPAVAMAVATQQTTVSSQQQFRQATYTEAGYRMVQSSTGGTDAQAVAYDNATGRQIYYTNHVAQPQHPLQATAQHYQAMAAATLNQEN